MKKNVKNWDLEFELSEMGILLEIVDYQRNKNDWGVKFYSLSDWIKNCGCGLKFVNRRAWLLNNRYVRMTIGVFDGCNFVSYMCMIGKEVEICKE